MPGDRTEHASPHRREKASQDGDVLRSRELTSAAGTLAGVLCVGALGHKFVESFRSLFIAVLNSNPNGWSEGGLNKTVLILRSQLLAASVPVFTTMAAIVGGSVVCGLLQGGGLQVSGKAIGLRLERVNPLANAKNLFSLRAASRLGKSLVPAVILGIFTVQRIGRELSIPPFSSGRIEMLGSDVNGLLSATAWLLLGWSLIDFMVEWRSRESRLMMSREEMKQEFKEMEGSPQTRSRIRGLQRQMRRRKVKADVAKAAVVLTNPTHYAVALGFDFATMEAPRVLAKGRNFLAEEIKTEARWAGVPIVENPPLARSLYRWVDQGQSIPADLYAAVATILAYLYRQRVEDEMRVRRNRQAGESGSGRSQTESSKAGASNHRNPILRNDGDRGVPK
jgi:flagellar biosynthesis protein FlhB